MPKLLDLILRHIVLRGTLTIIDAQGRAHRYGDGVGSPLICRILDRHLEWQLVYDPELALGEGYMQGRLVMQHGSIYDLLRLLSCNAQPSSIFGSATGLHVARHLGRRLAQFNPPFRARRNAAHHYDINARIYDLFLDRDRQYSCAYFAADNIDLEEAQLAKKRHLAAKLAVHPGQRVLDIGSGWGGLALYLAKVGDCDVTGATVSMEQLKIARARAIREGLSRAVRFEFKDYREIEGKFDRIVSVGMFEHVGVNHYPTFFRKVRDLLTADGVALIHNIGRSGQPDATNPFIAKYIFPGGYIPALSEMSSAIERSGLIVSDVEILRLHYARTLRSWRERFLDNRDKAVRIIDERFCRMWEFYLAASEIAFRYQNFVVFQVQLVKDVATLPLTRDYVGLREIELLNQESRRTTQEVVRA